MEDKIRIPSDLGRSIRSYRARTGLRPTDIAKRSGRSRNVLNRLERGEDITVASLMDILRAMGLSIRLESAGMPTLDEMQRRFAGDDDDDQAA